MVGSPGYPGGRAGVGVGYRGGGGVLCGFCVAEETKERPRRAVAWEDLPWEELSRRAHRVVGEALGEEGGKWKVTGDLAEHLGSERTIFNVFPKVAGHLNKALGPALMIPWMFDAIGALSENVLGGLFTGDLKDVRGATTLLAPVPILGQAIGLAEAIQQGDTENIVINSLILANFVLPQIPVVGEGAAVLVDLGVLVYSLVEIAKHPQKFIDEIKRFFSDQKACADNVMDKFAQRRDELWLEGLGKSFEPMVAGYVEMYRRAAQSVMFSLAQIEAAINHPLTVALRDPKYTDAERSKFVEQATAVKNGKRKEANDYIQWAAGVFHEALAGAARKSAEEANQYGQYATNGHAINPKPLGAFSDRFNSENEKLLRDSIGACIPTDIGGARKTGTDEYYRKFSWRIHGQFPGEGYNPFPVPDLNPLLDRLRRESRARFTVEPIPMIDTRRTVDVPDGVTFVRAGDQPVADAVDAPWPRPVTGAWSGLGGQVPAYGYLNLDGYTLVHSHDNTQCGLYPTQPAGGSITALSETAKTACTFPEGLPGLVDAVVGELPTTEEITGHGPDKSVVTAPVTLKAGWPGTLGLLPNVTAVIPVPGSNHHDFIAFSNAGTDGSCLRIHLDDPQNPQSATLAAGWSGPRSITDAYRDAIHMTIGTPSAVIPVPGSQERDFWVFAEMGYTYIRVTVGEDASIKLASGWTAERSFEDTNDNFHALNAFGATSDNGFPCAAIPVPDTDNHDFYVFSPAQDGNVAWLRIHIDDQGKASTVTPYQDVHTNPVWTVGLIRMAFVAGFMPLTPSGEEFYAFGAGNFVRMHLASSRQKDLGKKRAQRYLVFTGDHVTEVLAPWPGLLSAGSAVHPPTTIATTPLTDAFPGLPFTKITAATRINNPDLLYLFSDTEYVIFDETTNQLAQGPVTTALTFPGLAYPLTGSIQSNRTTYLYQQKPTNIIATNLLLQTGKAGNEYII
ncbi:hypothetical protein ACIQ9Q_43245, partial [Streptomyces sp. NPDC094438]